MGNKVPGTWLGRFRHEMNPRWHYDKPKKAQEMIEQQWFLGLDETEKMIRFIRGEQDEDDLIETRDFVDRIDNVLDTIEKVQLNTSVKDDEEQQQTLLNQRKALSVSMIRDLYDRVFDYYNSVFASDESRRKSVVDVDSIVQNIIQEKDAHRRVVHDALISTLHATIRFIRGNFAEMSEESLELWEETQEEMDIPILDVNRVRLPSNVFLPEGADINNRVHVAQWAIALYFQTGGKSETINHLLSSTENEGGIKKAS